MRAKVRANLALRAKVRAAREELVAEGLLRDSGRRRNGRIVWVITELGKQMAEQLRGDCRFPRRNLNS
jgi:hypothetical protein